MFVYCANNPVVLSDPTGTEYRVVGAGLQFEITVGGCSVGFEIICYWDVDECSNGGVVVAGYVYGGFSLDMDNPLIGSILATITDNSDLLVGGSEAEILALAALLGDTSSFSVSGVLVTGNEDFNSTTSYQGSFSSVGASCWRVKGSYAYSENCKAYSLGANFDVGIARPGWNVSKTYYERIFEINIGQATSGTSTLGGCNTGFGGVGCRSYANFYFA